MRRSGSRAGLGVVGTALSSLLPCHTRSRNVGDGWRAAWAAVGGSEKERFLVGVFDPSGEIDDSMAASMSYRRRAVSSVLAVRRERGRGRWQLPVPNSTEVHCGIASCGFSTWSCFYPSRGVWDVSLELP